MGRRLSSDQPADDDEGFRYRRSRTGSAWDRHYTVPDYNLAEKRFLVNLVPLGGIGRSVSIISLRTR